MRCQYEKTVVKIAYRILQTLILSKPDSFGLFSKLNVLNLLISTQLPNERLDKTSKTVNETLNYGEWE